MPRRSKAQIEADNAVEAQLAAQRRAEESAVAALDAEVNAEQSAAGDAVPEGADVTPIGAEPRAAVEGRQANESEELPVVGDYAERPYSEAVTPEHREVLEAAGLWRE